MGCEEDRQTAASVRTACVLFSLALSFCFLSSTSAFPSGVQMTARSYFASGVTDVFIPHFTNQRQFAPRDLTHSRLDEMLALEYLPLCCLADAGTGDAHCQHVRPLQAHETLSMRKDMDSNREQSSKSSVSENYASICPANSRKRTSLSTLHKGLTGHMEARHSFFM
jgi:hypothetical protein